MNISGWFLFSVKSPSSRAGGSDPEVEPDRQERPGQAVTEEVEASPAGELVLGVLVAQGRGYPRPAPSLGTTDILAGRTHEAASVQPVVIIRPQSHLARSEVSLSQVRELWLW